MSHPRGIRDAPAATPPVARSILAGILAAALALGALQVLELVLQGYQTPPSLDLVTAYLVLGVAAVLCGAVVRRLARAPAAPIATDIALGAALLYAPLLSARVADGLGRQGLSAGLQALGGLLAIAAYGAWIAALRRLAGRQHTALALALGAALAAALLAWDRHLLASALSAQALFCGAALGATTLAAAVATRRSGPTRPLSLLAATAALAALFAASRHHSPVRRDLPPPRAAAERPADLILIVIDTLRADVFRSVVDETEEGRAFRTAMRGSVWFDNAFAVAPWTLPAMGSLMTGLYPAEHGLQESRRLDSSIATLAEELRRRGYVSEEIGTNLNLHPGTGIYRGFDRYTILEGAAWKFPLASVFAGLGLRATEPPYQNAAAVRRHLRARLRALADTESPLFLWLHLMDPHEPLQPHPALAIETGGVALTPLERLYRDNVRYALAQVALLREDLEARQRWSNALVVVTSDHGEMLPSDGHTSSVRRADGEIKNYGHGHALYDTLLRVPLLMRPPGGVPEDRQVEALLNQVDIHRTIADALGVAGDELDDHDEVSLIAYLTRRAVEPPPPRVATVADSLLHGLDQRCVRTERWKLIEERDGERRDQLFDLAADPGETANLANTQSRQRASATDLLRQSYARMSPQSAPAAAPLNLATKERLRALGYGE